MKKNNIKPPIFWQKAKKILSKKDNKLSKIINNYPDDFLFSKLDPFYTLARSIVGQQISVKSAQSVWNKLEVKIIRIKPKIIATTHSSTLKSVGLSRQKVGYLKNLANAVIEKKLRSRCGTS